MFERFTAAARAAVVQAQDEARELRHPRIGTEHLLLGVLSDPTSPASRVLAGFGLDHDGVRRSVVELVAPPPGPDAVALDTLGIDLGEVRRRVEASFGPGALDDPEGGLRRHLRFGSRAKKVWSSPCAGASVGTTTRSGPRTSCSASCVSGRASPR